MDVPYKIYVSFSCGAIVYVHVVCYRSTAIAVYRKANPPRRVDENLNLIVSFTTLSNFNEYIDKYQIVKITYHCSRFVRINCINKTNISIIRFFAFSYHRRLFSKKKKFLKFIPITVCL